MLQPLKKIPGVINRDMRLFEKEFNDALYSKVRLIQTVSRFLIKQKGKRIRPMLTILSARMCGEPTDNSYKAAAMIELLHIATLIHDDVVDGAVRRRGWLSINRIWGNKLAVLLGDYVLSKSLIYMIKLKDFDVLEIISKTAELMSSGEILQLDQRFKKYPTEDIYFDLIRQKTASLIATGCELGALTTSRSAQDCKSMSSFGYNLGMAYQIRDDLFDLLGNESYTGKDSGIDVKKNTLTLPIIHSLQSLPKSESRTLLKLVKMKHNSKDTLTEIMQLVKKGNGFVYAQEKIDHYTQSAIESLSAYTDSIYKNSMITLAQFNRTRVH
jgi:octaprenyl-diphosphate synthase|tara:strand:- start:3306 stop:4286 length:981 start_codon:yes stop_codon:yes gene_type:complete